MKRFDKKYWITSFIYLGVGIGLGILWDMSKIAFVVASITLVLFTIGIKS